MNAPIDDGGPAFPALDYTHYQKTGMTLRDWFAGQALAALLFEVPPTDAGSFALAGLAVLAAAAGVALGPCRRAARVDPAVTLRAEG